MMKNLVLLLLTLMAASPVKAYSESTDVRGKAFAVQVAYTRDHYSAQRRAEKELEKVLVETGFQFTVDTTEADLGFVVYLSPSLVEESAESVFGSQTVYRDVYRLSIQASGDLDCSTTYTLDRENFKSELKIAMAEFARGISAGSCSIDTGGQGSDRPGN